MTAIARFRGLARRITEHAYRAGASVVTTLWGRRGVRLLRYRYASDASFDHASKWLYDGMAAAFKERAARLAINRNRSRTALQRGIPGRLGAPIAVSQVYRPAPRELIHAATSINWTIVRRGSPALGRGRVSETNSPDEALAESCGNAHLRNHAHSTQWIPASEWESARRPNGA